MEKKPRASRKKFLLRRRRSSYNSVGKKKAAPRSQLATPHGSDPDSLKPVDLDRTKGSRQIPEPRAPALRGTGKLARGFRLCQSVLPEEVTEHMATKKKATKKATKKGTKKGKK
jgi:hypothetical protein